jgi:hypothetical protein
VAQLDQELFLTDEQRKRMVETLSRNWRHEWSQTVEMHILMHNRPFLPPLPDKDIAPLLNPTQREVWRGTQRTGQVFFHFGFGLARGPMIVDDFDVGNAGGGKENAVVNDVRDSVHPKGNDAGKEAGGKIADEGTKAQE